MNGPNKKTLSCIFHAMHQQEDCEMIPAPTAILTGMPKNINFYTLDFHLRTSFDPSHLPMKNIRCEAQESLQLFLLSPDHLLRWNYL